MIRHLVYRFLQKEKRILWLGRYLVFFSNCFFFLFLIATTKFAEAEGLIDGLISLLKQDTPDEIDALYNVAGALSRISK